MSAEPATDSPSPTEADSFVCPHCKQAIEAAEINRWTAARAGRGKSEKKAKSSAANGIKGGLAKSEKKAKSSVAYGKKGGRPRKPRPENN